MIIAMLGLLCCIWVDLIIVLFRYKRMICCNGVHTAFAHVEAAVKMPLLHIVDVAAILCRLRSRSSRRDP